MHITLQSEMEGLGRILICQDSCLFQGSAYLQFMVPTVCVPTAEQKDVAQGFCWGQVQPGGGPE